MCDTEVLVAHPARDLLNRDKEQGKRGSVPPKRKHSTYCTRVVVVPLSILK